jgi:ribosome-associated toxin RatA of RatAB toxin-antitoxin module
MADQATERLTIHAPPERCLEVVLDFERYPEWAADVKEAAVLERDPEGRATSVGYRVAAMGRSARYTLAYDYSGLPREISWRLLESDIMRRLDGHYVFEPSGGNTEVLYELAIELVLPLPGFVKRRAESKIISTALRELKRQVEADEATRGVASSE